MYSIISVSFHTEPTPSIFMLCGKRPSIMRRYIVDFERGTIVKTSASLMQRISSIELSFMGEAGVVVPVLGISAATLLLVISAIERTSALAIEEELLLSINFSKLGVRIDLGKASMISGVMGSEMRSYIAHKRLNSPLVGIRVKIGLLFHHLSMQKTYIIPKEFASCQEAFWEYNLKHLGSKDILDIKSSTFHVGVYLGVCIEVRTK